MRNGFGFKVTFIRRNDLPPNHAWAMARDRSDGTVYFFVKRCELCARVLEEGWAAYRRLASRIRAVA